MNNETEPSKDNLAEPLQKPVLAMGTATRNSMYREVYAATKDHHAAVRAYCAGNVWLTENAKAVGNW